MIKSESYYNERIRFSLKKGIQLGKVMGRIQAFEEFKEMINKRIKAQGSYLKLLSTKEVKHITARRIDELKELKQKLKEAQNE